MRFPVSSVGVCSFHLSELSTFSEKRDPGCIFFHIDIRPLFVPPASMPDVKLSAVKKKLYNKMRNSQYACYIIHSFRYSKAYSTSTKALNQKVNTPSQNMVPTEPIYMDFL